MNKIQSVLILTAASWLAGCAGGSVKPLVPVPKTVFGFKDADALICHYQKTQVMHDRKEQNLPAQDWYFMRLDHQTQSYDPTSAQREIWELDNQGKASLLRVIESEKVILEYSPGDLAASGKKAEWSQVWSIIDSNRFGKDLAKVDAWSEQSVQIEQYKSSNGQEVLWLKDLRLPMQIITKADDGDIDQFELMDCKKPENSEVKPLSAKQMQDNYRRIDSIDLGDMESDPVVKRILKSIGEEGHHH